MNIKYDFALLFIFLFCSASTLAQEQAEEDVTQKQNLETQQPDVPLSHSEQPSSSLLVPWKETTGIGFGIGYDHGFWGGSWAQSVRLKIPIHKHWNIIARGILVVRDQPESDDNNSDLVLGGRIELHGQSRVLLNVIRLYGGGGIQIFAPVDGSEKESISGGGQFGFEFFFSSEYSFYIEIGGNGGALELSGATVVAGLQIYPF